MVGEGGATRVPVVEVEVAGDSRLITPLLRGVPIPSLLLHTLPARTRSGSEKFCCSESS